MVPLPAEECVQGSGFRVQGSGCRVQGAGFRVQGSGCRVQKARERERERKRERSTVHQPPPRSLPLTPHPIGLTTKILKMGRTAGGVSSFGSPN